MAELNSDKDPSQAAQMQVSSARGFASFGEMDRMRIKVALLENICLISKWLGSRCDEIMASPGPTSRIIFKRHYKRDLVQRKKITYKGNCF